MSSPRFVIVCLWLSAIPVSTSGCSSGQLGDSCDETSDCSKALQCFGGYCALRCESPFDCGDGYLCSDDGLCSAVESAIGDPCDRELDCGPGQSCLLNDEANAIGELEASCQGDVPGAGTGTACASDSDCRGSTCALGRCTQLCQVDEDCPMDLACVDIPRALLTTDSEFSGCTQGQGVLRVPVLLDLPFQTISIPVPSHARSFSLVTTVEPGQLVGMARLTSPSGETLFATPFSPQEALDNPIRYETDEEVSAALIPNSPAVDLELGIYRAEIGSFLPAGGVGTAIPSMEILYKLDDGASLDLHFYFLNLEEHPCETLAGGALSAEAAEERTDFQGYIGDIFEVFAGAGINRGDVSYTDILERPDLDAATEAGAGSLARLARPGPGLHVFFVRNLEPAGLQALSTGTPGAPVVGNTLKSAIAIGVDTLCYRDWNQLARRTAHALAQQMGLFDSVSPDGTPDPIADTGISESNLMHFSEFGGTELSTQQSVVLRKWPGLR